MGLLLDSMALVALLCVLEDPEAQIPKNGIEVDVMQCPRGLPQELRTMVPLDELLYTSVHYLYYTVVYFVTLSCTIR